MKTLDQSVENLIMLNELLRATNPVVESGSADLAKAAHTVAGAEQHLSTDLDHLATEVDAIQKQVETSGAEAVKALTELAHTADEVHAGVGAVDTDAAAAQAHWTEALHEKGAGLDAAFGELKSSGWDPLVASLHDEQADFDKWLHTADDALHGLALAVGVASVGITKTGEMSEERAKELEETAPLKEDYWQATQRDARKIAEETIPEFGHSVVRHTGELTGACEQVMTAIDDGSNHVRAQLDLTIEKAVNALEAQATAMTKAAEEAEGHLQAVQSRYELSATHGEEAQMEGAQLLELAGHVVEAQAQLAKVREVLEAIGQ